MKLLQDVPQPWRHFVICALLNRTTGAKVAEVLPRLWDRYPVPGSFADAVYWPKDLEARLRPLGMQKVKARHVVDIAHYFYTKPNWKSPASAGGEWPPHCGPYAQQSFRILFLRERPKDIVDAKLREYVATLPPGALRSRR